MRLSDYITLSEAVGFDQLIDALEPGQVLNLVKKLAKDGIDAQHLNDLAQTRDYLSRLIDKAREGKIPVRKPQKGSFYDKTKQRREKYADPGGFERVKKMMVKYVSAGEPYKEEIRLVLMRERMRRTRAKK